MSNTNAKFRKNSSEEEQLVNRNVTRVIKCVLDSFEIQADETIEAERALSDVIKPIIEQLAQESAAVEAQKSNEKRVAMPEGHGDGSCIGISSFEAMVEERDNKVAENQELLDLNVRQKNSLSLKDQQVKGLEDELKEIKKASAAEIKDLKKKLTDCQAEADHARKQLKSAGESAPALTEARAKLSEMTALMEAEKNRAIQAEVKLLEMKRDFDTNRLEREIKTAERNLEGCDEVTSRLQAQGKLDKAQAEAWSTFKWEWMKIKQVLKDRITALQEGFENCMNLVKTGIPVGNTPVPGFLDLPPQPDVPALLLQPPQSASSSPQLPDISSLNLNGPEPSLAPPPGLRPAVGFGNVDAASFVNRLFRPTIPDPGGPVGRPRFAQPTGTLVTSSAASSGASASGVPPTQPALNGGGPFSSLLRPYVVQPSGVPAPRVPAPSGGVPTMAPSPPVPSTTTPQQRPPPQLRFALGQQRPSGVAARMAIPSQPKPGAGGQSSSGASPSPVTVSPAGSGSGDGPGGGERISRQTARSGVRMPSRRSASEDASRSTPSPQFQPGVPGGGVPMPRFPAPGPAGNFRMRLPIPQQRRRPGENPRVAAARPGQPQAPPPPAADAVRSPQVQQIIDKILERHPGRTNQDAIEAMRRFKETCPGGKFLGVRVDQIIDGVEPFMRESAPMTRPRQRNASGSDVGPSGPASPSVARPPSDGRSSSTPESAEDDDDLLECPICHDPLDPGKLSSHQDCKDCGKMYHSVCLKQWLQRNKTCPMCRSLYLDRDEYPPLHS